MRGLLFGWAAILLGLVAASPALALDTGQCLPAAEVRTALAAEKMQPVVVGNRTGFGYTASFIFFADADLSRGYLVRGDKPLGQASGKACIDSVYRDIRLNDVSRPGIPAWALLPGMNADAVDLVCRRDRLGYQERCSLHDPAIIGQSRNNQRVMLMATGTAINPRDQSVRSGQRIVLTLQPDRRIGLVEATTVEGANYMLSGYAEGAFTEFGSALLGTAQSR